MTAPGLTRGTGSDGSTFPEPVGGQAGRGLHREELPIPTATLGTGHPVLHPAWDLRSKAGGPAPPGLLQLGLSELHVLRAHCEPVQRYRCLRVREAPDSAFTTVLNFNSDGKTGCCLRLDLQKQRRAYETRTAAGSEAGRI